MLSGAAKNVKKVALAPCKIQGLSPLGAHNMVVGVCKTQYDARFVLYGCTKHCEIACLDRWGAPKTLNKTRSLRCHGPPNTVKFKVWAAMAPKTR